MQLINDITNELLNTEISLSLPLLKAKLLASRLNNQILLNWVNNELIGYKEIDLLPKYRKHTGEISGTFINSNFKYNNQPIPLNGLSTQTINFIKEVNFGQSISTLENMKSEDKTGFLYYTFPAEVTGLIEINWKKMGNPFLHIINCEQTIGISVIDEILSNVRSKLLDFMLKIDAEFGNITEIETLKNKSDIIEKFVSQTIINTGDGNIINTGDNSILKTKTSILKGDKEGLKKYLNNIGLQKEDVISILDIIDKEQPNYETKTFGENVNNWISKILTKSLDGSWNIGIGAAGSLIAEAIKNYYGM